MSLSGKKTRAIDYIDVHITATYEWYVHEFIKLTKYFAIYVIRYQYRPNCKLR